MQKIKLLKIGGLWCAKWENAPEIVELFNTDTIPTPFTDTAPAEMVLNTIRAKNPGAIVEIGGAV